MSNWDYGFGIAGYHYLNLVGPITIAIIATREPLKAPQGRWRDVRAPDITGFLRDPYCLYEVIYPNEHRYLDGAIQRSLRSLERKLFLIGLEEGVYIPSLNIKTLAGGEGYTPWVIARTVRDEYMRAYDYHYPELELTKNRGYLKYPQIAKLMNYKVIPPFIIHERIQRFAKGI